MPINEGFAAGEVADVNVTASALPTGAATSANQTTGNSSLSSIDTKVTGLALETTQGTGNTRLGDLAETAPATDTASSGLNGRLQRIAQRLTSILTTLTDRTQKTQISNGTNEAAIQNSPPSSNAYGIVVRQVPFELPTFSVVAENIVVGNNKSMIAIQNTGTSVAVLREIWIINDQTTAVTGVAGQFRAHRITSFSSGTALTPVANDTNDSLPSGISVATGATIVGESGLLRAGTWSTDEWGPGTADVESADHGQQQVEPFWKQTPSGKGLVVRQNQGIHVRFATNSTAGAFNLRLIFTISTTE